VRPTAAPIEPPVSDEQEAGAMPPKPRAAVAEAGPAPDSNGQRQPVAELQHAVYTLMAAQRRLNWRAKRSGGSIAPDRLRVLMVLEVEGEATHSQLVRETELTPATISVMVDELVGGGLVQRRRDASDGRVWWITLTDDGRAVTARHREAWVRTFADAFGATPDADLGTAVEVIDRVTEILESIAND
jgi:DNA-binding MarR family transcriptional regulator